MINNDLPCYDKHPFCYDIRKNQRLPNYSLRINKRSYVLCRLISGIILLSLELFTDARSNISFGVKRLAGIICIHDTDWFSTIMRVIHL